jgi:cytidine deaminase
MSDTPPQDLIEAAKNALPNSYSPYSNFKVAAALRFENNKIYSGTNCENASYGLTVCAERIAFFTASNEGCRQLKEVLVYTPTPEPVTPCGACRQVLREFAPNPSAVKCWAVCESDDILCMTLEELLPKSFGPENLE